MSRKFAAFVATTTAVAFLVLGSAIAVALGNMRPPTPAVATTQTSTQTSPQTSTQTSPQTSTQTSTQTSPQTSTQTSATPSPTPAQTPNVNAPTTPRRPIPNPTAGLAAGNNKVLFLTFDDGPDPAWTPQVLAVLAKYDAHATFFELGSMQAAHPGLREQVLAAGNTIGSHSITHPELTVLSPAKRRHEIFDGPQSNCFRPPYGATNAKVRADIRAAGMAQVLWDVDPRDWARPGTQAIVQNILTHAHNHSIILLHDGGGDRSQTLAALDKALPLLKAQGYSFPAMDC